MQSECGRKLEYETTKNQCENVPFGVEHRTSNIDILAENDLCHYINTSFYDQENHI